MNSPTQTQVLENEGTHQKIFENNVKNFQNQKQEITQFNEPKKSHLNEKELDYLKKNLIQFYMKKEDISNILLYGRNVFSYLKSKEKDSFIPKNYLSQDHIISSVVRMKMVDWMLEIIKAFELDDDTFILSVNIMDYYIANEKSIRLKDDDIHLIGMCCIFLASKIEDIIPLRMSNIVNEIGHRRFSSKTIEAKERHIVKILNFNFHKINTIDFVKTLFSDFLITNSEDIIKLDGDKYLKKFFKLCIFIGQLTLYDEKFYSFLPSIISIGIISLGFDLMKTNMKQPEIEKKKSLFNYVHDWICYLINELKLNSDEVKEIYDDLSASYKKYILDPVKKSNGNIEDDNLINLYKYK